MPDGSSLPEWTSVPNYLPGFPSIQTNHKGGCTVKRAVSPEERRAREDAEPTLWSDYQGRRRYRGSKERLIRDGISEAWLEGLPLPGKKRGRRKLYEGELEIEVGFSENGFNVEITHVDYYRDFGRDRYLRMRAEYGLPLIVRGHLSLVSSREEARHG